MDENCMNCDHRFENCCEEDFYKETKADYELESTWCTNWKLKVDESWISL